MAILPAEPSSVFADSAVVDANYRVVGRLAAGGMGVAYEVEQLATGARRALKAMNVQMAREAKLRARFVQEARVGAVTSRISKDDIGKIFSGAANEGGGGRQRRFDSCPRARRRVAYIRRLQDARPRRASAGPFGDSVRIERPSLGRRRGRHRRRRVRRARVGAQREGAHGRGRDVASTRGVAAHDLDRGLPPHTSIYLCT
jgi:hypothetical protein